MCSWYKKSRHGYGDTHVGMDVVEAVCRPEIRTRRSAPDAGEGKPLIKGKTADSCLLCETTGRLSVSRRRPVFCCLLVLTLFTQARLNSDRVRERETGTEAQRILASTPYRVCQRYVAVASNMSGFLLKYGTLSSLCSGDNPPKA